LIYNALESLRNQTDNDFEIILINDSSPHQLTNDICKKIESEKQIRVLWTDFNSGLSGARNLAIEKMNGDVAVLLDADDTLPPNSINDIRFCFDNHPNADFVFGNYFIAQCENTCTSITDCSGLTDGNGRLSPVNLTRKWSLLGTSPFKKALWQRIGGYSKEFSNTCQDVDFFQRALLSGAIGYYTSSAIYNWNRNLSGMNSTQAQKEAFDICNYKNVDFYFKFSSDLLDAFAILNLNKDYNEIKSRAKTLRWSSLYSIFSIVPAASIPYFFMLFAKCQHLHSFNIRLIKNG